MTITRTANAGVLLEMDDVSVLLDGICGEVPPYPATPQAIRERLYDTLPQAVAFTHTHIDHYDQHFAQHFMNTTGKEIVSPAGCREMQVENVRIQSLDTRHMGRNDVEHISLVLTGSKCVWFMGDASPTAFKQMETFPKPDVLMVPFAYLNSKSSVETTKRMGAKWIVALHMPDVSNDVYQIRETVQNCIANEPHIRILEIGETFSVYA